MHLHAKHLLYPPGSPRRQPLRQQRLPDCCGDRFWDPATEVRIKAHHSSPGGGQSGLRLGVFILGRRL